MNTNICPTCKTSIPANAPGGFCPACILRDADELPPIGRTAPTLEEVRAAFPQLEVLELIGQGGMGFVYKARQPSLDRTVALKILSPELGRDPAFAERFAREARVLGKLNHPNIVTVFEHGESGGFFYLIMEYVDGVNLRQAMRAGRFTPAQALAVVPGICDALQAAHAQGVWHRDIKPENILLDAQGGVKIVDFGIARIVGDPQRDFTLTMTGAALGSAAYMAPEQHESPHDVDHRADIYSLGVVIYEMLTGELPLGRFKAPSTKAAVDARIDEIVFRTLEKERELRQQSAAEVKTDVHRAANAPTSVPAPAPVPENAVRLASKIALIGGLVLFIAAAVFTAGSTQGVLLTISTTVFVLGALGLLFGKSPAAAGSAGAAPVTVRSIALFIGGIVAVIAGAVLVQSEERTFLAADSIRVATRAFIFHTTERKLGALLVILGGTSALAGWIGLWTALSRMRQGRISTDLRVPARILAWLPIAFAIFTVGMFFKRRGAEQAVIQAAISAVEQTRVAAMQTPVVKRPIDPDELAKATQANAGLKARFPNLSTPEGAVVAYYDALHSGDVSRLLASVPKSTVAQAENAEEYAKELIAENRKGRIVQDDTYILTSVAETNSDFGAIDVPSRRRILGRNPGPIKFVEYEIRVLGQNPGRGKSRKVCVSEDGEWRVIPGFAPSKSTAPAAATPPVRTGRLITSEKIVNGVRTVEKKFVTDTGEEFPSVEAANLAEQQKASPTAPAGPVSAETKPMRIHFLPGNRLEVDGKAETPDELIARLKQPNDGKTKWRFEVETEAGVEGRFIADVLQKMQAAGAKFDEDVMAKLRDSMKEGEAKQPAPPESAKLEAPVVKAKTPLVKAVISLRANGDLQLDGKPVAFDALGEQLKKLFPDPPNGVVSLAFEKDTKFENVSRVMDLVERAGIMIVAIDRQAPAANAPLQATPMRIHFLPGNRLEVDGKAETPDELIARLKQPNDGKTKWRFEVETEAGVEGRFIADVLQKMQAAGAKFDEDVMAKLRDSMKAEK